jgi:subtilase family serine protease
LRLTIALEPRDPAGLQALASAVSTPGSPGYRHYLSVPEFAARFGATPQQIQSVQSALRAEGLSVGRTRANDLMIPVTGTAAQVEKAFSVSESQVALPGGRVAFANTQAPALPSSAARYVQGVIGLANVALAKPQGLAVHGSRPSSSPGVEGASASRGQAARAQAIGSGPAPCSDASAQDDFGYTADEIAGAYGLDSFYANGDKGAGETVALYEQESYQATDIATFQSCYGTNATVSNVDVDGGPGTFNRATDDDAEAALDIEQVIGLAPKANVLVYQGPPDASPADIIGAIVSDDQAQVISSSWGLCEALTDSSVISAEDTSLQEAATQGQTFMASSGDSGSTTCYQATSGDPQPDESLSVIDPGSQPFATGVGGTTMGEVTNNGNDFALPRDGSYPGEFVWNDGLGADGASATGGGVSDQWAMPSYQADADASLGVVSADSSMSCSAQLCRQVPDVSADADPNSGYTVFADGGTRNGGWVVVGGTSASAPLWAAFTALANASPICQGVALGFLNPALYQLAGSSYQANFHDVTLASPFTDAANNDAFTGGDTANPDSLYPLATGYDMATGLGTPVGDNLGDSLCLAKAPAITVSVTNPGSQSATAGQSVAVAIHASDSGGQPLTFTAVGLPAGLTINSASGVISGTPSTAQATTVTVTATDRFSNSGSTNFSWTVASPPPVPPAPAFANPPAPVNPPALVKPPALPGRPTASSVELSGLSRGRPSLAFRLAAGRNAAALKSVSISLPRGLSFAHGVKTLGRGIVVRSGGRKIRFTLRLIRGVLTITFRSPVRSASLTLGKPAITVAGSEASRIRHHQVRRLTVNIRTTDTSRRTLKLALTLKKFS